MKDYYTARELAELYLPGLPCSKQGVIDVARRCGWRARPRAGRGGGREFDVNSLPPAARDELLRRAAVDAGESAPVAVGPIAALPALAINQLPRAELVAIAEFGFAVLRGQQTDAAREALREALLARLLAKIGGGR